MIKRNQRHFGQAQGTPFTEGTLREEVDWAATTQEAEDILAGTYKGEVDEEQCIAVLKACKIAADVSESPAEL